MRDDDSATYLDRLGARLRERTAVIGVVGLGHVGLPLALRFAAAGFKVLGFDTDAARVARLNEGSSYLAHVDAREVARARARRFEATTDFNRAGLPHALVICVPAPLKAYREPDLSFLLDTTETLLPLLRAGQLLALESTTYPGTTEEELLPRLQARGFSIGRDVFVVYSAPSDAAGKAAGAASALPKVCGGATPACLEAGLALYRAAGGDVAPVSSPRAAELARLLGHVQRAVNIGLVNEMKLIADKMDIDIHEVIRAAARPSGDAPYIPGPGLGGPRLPTAPFYLAWKARQHGVHTRFIELADDINGDMPHWVIGKLADALNKRGRAVMGSRVLVLGLAYKKDVADLRESPSLELMDILRDKGAVVDYADPHIPVLPRMREHPSALASVALTPQAIASYDVVLLATDHSAFDYGLIRQHASLIVDTRGVYREPAPNVVKA